MIIDVGIERGNNLTGVVLYFLLQDIARNIISERLLLDHRDNLLIEHQLIDQQLTFTLLQGANLDLQSTIELVDGSV